jgi:hypothetical protein
MDAGFDGRNPDPHGRVAVLSHFDGSWCHGFEVAAVAHEPDGHSRLRLRRISDGEVLPAWFDSDEVIPDRY